MLGIAIVQTSASGKGLLDLVSLTQKSGGASFLQFMFKRFRQRSKLQNPGI